MKKIVILALHLSTGGTERTIATLSNILIKKYDVEIISNYQIGEKPAFLIDERVKIHYLMPNLKPNAREFKQAIKKWNVLGILKEGMKALKILYLRRKQMIKAVQNLSCDVAISTRPFHTKILGKYANSSILKIAQEHNNNGNKRYIRKVLKSLKNIDYLMPVSKELTKMYSQELKNNPTKCMYIPHCLQNFTNKVSTLEDTNIISIGRLSQEKGFLDLVDIWEMVVKQNSNWHLTIVGDGKLKEAIEEKIKEKNLQSSITLLGFQKEEVINTLLEHSSIYVMTSFYESFGLVLIEAASFGIPLLAFDTAHGAREIIENEENGFLIPNRDKEKMASQISELIENLTFRKKIGQNARKKSEIYKMENVEKIWFEFLNQNIKY